MDISAASPLPTDPVVSCPGCHIAVKSTDYFCFNCGRNLHPAPPPSTPGVCISYLLGSIVLPPLGAIWGMRYIVRSKAKWGKLFGFFLIILTGVECIVLVALAIKTYNTTLDQVNRQMQNIQGF